MRLHLSWALIFGAAATGLASDDPVGDLKRMIASKRIASVAELIGELPETMRSNWTPVFDSLSLQPGTRILMRSADNDLTLTFNLDPRRGFDAVEIKGRSREHGGFNFAEIDFESDAKRVAGGPPDPRHFVHGVEISENVVERKIHGNFVGCASCHPLGRTRFDLREMLSHSRTGGDHRRAAEDFLTKLRNGSDARLKKLVVPPTLTRIATDGDLAGLEDFLVRRLGRTHTELAGANAEIVAEKVARDAQKDPRVGLQMLAVLKGCDLDAILNRAEWNAHVDALPFLAADRKAALLWHGARPNVRALLGDVAKQIDRKLEERSDRGEPLADPMTDPDLLAKLIFVWDPFVTALRGESIKPTENTRVDQWPMTAHFAGHFYGGTFALYRQALMTRFSAHVARSFNLVAEKQTCERLTRLIEASARDGRAPSGRVELGEARDVVHDAHAAHDLGTRVHDRDHSAPNHVGR